MRKLSAKIAAVVAVVLLSVSCSDDDTQSIEVSYTYINDSSYDIYVYDESSLGEYWGSVDDLFLAIAAGESQTYKNVIDVVIAEEADISVYCLPRHLFGMTMQLQQEIGDDIEIIANALFGYSYSSLSSSPLNSSAYTSERISSSSLEFTYTFTDDKLYDILYPVDEEE